MSNNKETDQIIDGHEYDGIKEFDNPLPGWWLTTFYLTIIFAVGYYVYYEMMDGPSSDAELKIVMDKIEHNKEEKKKKSEEKLAKVDLEALVNDKAVVEKGKAVFAKNCVACHLADGGGLIGSNLTDDYFIFGTGKVAEIKKVVTEGGREGKGMIPWGPVLSEDDILNVSVFVKTLQGTTPAIPKAAEGNKAK